MPRERRVIIDYRPDRDDDIHVFHTSSLPSMLLNKAMKVCVLLMREVPWLRVLCVITRVSTGVNKCYELFIISVKQYGAKGDGKVDDWT